MKVFCKKTCFNFKKGEYYKVDSIHSIFEPDDFITLKNEILYRFRLNTSIEFIEDFIGSDEYYFYDYFCDIKKDRKNKLEYIFKINFNI